MEGFHFFTKVDQTILLGSSARNVEELLENIKQVPDSSIYHHTHRFLQQHQYLSPEPPNDFAYWVSHVLGDETLGERLWSVDIVQFQKISDLRAEFVALLESYLGSTRRRIDCPEGAEFHFMAARTFVLPTGYEARSPGQFADALAKVSVQSLYYHIFDAKLRLERGENDFSRWFRSIGEIEVADKIRHLDPYAHTLEGLRKSIIALVRKYDSH